MAHEGSSPSARTTFCSRSNLPGATKRSKPASTEVGLEQSILGAILRDGIDSRTNSHPQMNRERRKPARFEWKVQERGHRHIQPRVTTSRSEISTPATYNVPNSSMLG